MVLEIRWLKELGSIFWNFEDLTMQFTYQGRAVILKGLTLAKLIEEGPLNHDSKLEKRGVFIHVIKGEEDAG